MKRYKRFLFVCIAACSLFLGGCGDALFVLTPEEEELIVHYAAYVTAKHNIQQKDGMSGVYVPDEIPQDSESTDSTETPDDGQNPNGGDGSGEGQQMGVSSISLAEAIGHGSDLVITFTGSSIADNYIEGSADSGDAQEGYTFYVMKFLITNISQQDVELNNVVLRPGFKLTAGELAVTSEETFLMSDFSTYMGTIEAGKSVEAVLLFEVPKSAAEGITEPGLQIIINNESKNVKL